MYKKKVVEEKPRLEISYDEMVESPRDWSNLGYFITCDGNYSSPDNVFEGELRDWIKETGQEVASQDEHIKVIKDWFKLNTDEKVLEIYPITKYEHSGVSYSLGDKFGFDYSNNGFYIITDKTQKEVGTDKKDFEKVIGSELEIYNKYCNGEIYRFYLHDKDGEEEDSCCGFYEVEDIRECLPKEFKDEDLMDYFVYN